MTFSFTVTSKTGDMYKVSLLSGDDAFFAKGDILNIVGENIEIVEIDLDRIKGNSQTDTAVLSKIADGIANYFISNEKVVLYYYCDDLAELPASPKRGEMWPQEYRSMLFSLMFKRYLIRHDISDVIDVTIMIEQGPRPLLMHLIARKKHQKYLDLVRSYIIDNYGK